MKHIKVGTILPSVRGFSGGVKRTLKILENARSAKIDFTVFTPIDERYDKSALDMLKKLQRDNLIDLVSARAKHENLSHKDFDLIVIPEENWLTPMLIIKELKLEGPYGIIFQLLPWIRSLDVLKVKKEEEVSMTDLLSMPRLNKKLFGQSVIDSVLRVGLGTPYIQALKFFHNWHVGTSKATAYQLQRLGFKNIYVIDPLGGVDFDTVKKAREEHNGECVYDACYFARLVPEKGFFDVVYIVYTAKKILGKNIKVAVCGIPQKKRHVELFLNAVKKLNLENSIVFLGKLNEKNLFNTILKSKLLIYPSYVDSFPLTVAETLSLGIPVLAYDTDAIRLGYSQNKSVLSVKVGDYETMGKTLAQIMKDENVDAIKTIAEKESIDVVRRLSWDNVVKAERGFYEWVIRTGY